MRRAKKTQRRVLLREVLDELKALRFELQQSRAATERNSIWVAQAARGKDSAGNWR